MYFQIENTPEHLRRARRLEVVSENSTQEECPQLILAPFSKPPQVIFENVVIGSSCERILEIYNPTDKIKHIIFEQSLPTGLVIQIPEDSLTLEPETCYCISIIWTPMQPVASRKTIRFTDENRGRYDVIIILKSVMTVKKKAISPGKIKKKGKKKSPKDVLKKKLSITCKSSQVEVTVDRRQSTHYKIIRTEKENLPSAGFSVDSHVIKCPFDSPSSDELNFNTSEIFSNFKNTYNKSPDIRCVNTTNSPVRQNVLKPSNRQAFETSATDIFDNLTFTPLKSLSAEYDKLNKETKIINNIDFVSNFDDVFDIKMSNKENETHSIVDVIISEPPIKCVTPKLKTENEKSTAVRSIIPNTSSPKEMNAHHFTFNTDFSRISDLSYRQSFSTEKKIFHKMSNETQELINDSMLNKLSSDTYTKESPYVFVEPHYLNFELKNQPYSKREETQKLARQQLFGENYKDFTDKYNTNCIEQNMWHADTKNDLRSPPRSLTPPLQSIPEESDQISETQILEQTQKHTTTFTFNRTFDKNSETKSSTSTLGRQSWSKKAVRAEPELWKVPMPVSKKAVKVKNKNTTPNKVSNATYVANKSTNQNISLNTVGNVYSQSYTVDPFLSSTYYYDEQAVEKYEREFKRWLNCILTPPADLDCNIEKKIDIGKAWIENRNKEIPAAPTKEQVSSHYHNSHRLESLRRSAKALLLSPEIAQVIVKLHSQIDKKTIAIRNDKNLHLDVGLQKIIMEIILSYNPLWLRIGLEAIYRVVIPLKSNSDIEGLTTFIIQRMFKNPFMKNKHSKSAVPNILLPAYMEAIKKFTLKKFFMLVFFLDKAKQKKLISHDPCLFCRNAICKESKEIIIHFTRELVKGVGDITKHLRTLGYVVTHKQSFLDEYKYAVHNIAVDLRDGVRLTKVMEIILMKDGLLNQMRAPAISRLQKKHNVQVALTALKEANFEIVGEITAYDIADGHREKTLSLLWQLIHVFRAPLFEKAANVLQIWWRKIYAKIVEKQKQEKKQQERLNMAANIVQTWWRRIQNKRMVAFRKQQFTNATVVIQKNIRRKLCRVRFLKQKSSVITIEEWYRRIKRIKAAQMVLEKLRAQRDEARRRAATIIQACVRRWLCYKQFKLCVRNIIRIQSIIRCVIARKRYLRLKKSACYIQEKYRGKLKMRELIKSLSMKIKSVVVIQSVYRMTRERKIFLTYKKSVRTIENRYIALIQMRKERTNFLLLRKIVIKAQAIYRGNRQRMIYNKCRNIIIKVQRRVKARQAMLKQRNKFTELKKAIVVIQNHYKAHLAMKASRSLYLSQRKSAILIQRHYRSYKLAELERGYYLRLRKSAITIQIHYKSLLIMRVEKRRYMELKTATITLQRRYRALILMRFYKNSYQKLRKAAVTIQMRYRALSMMRKDMSEYEKLKHSCIVIQNIFRAHLERKRARTMFIKKKEAAIKIQNWFRAHKTAKEVREQYDKTKKACLTIQHRYKAYIIGKTVRHEYTRVRTATICIQKYYRSYLIMKRVRREYIVIRSCTVTIQRYYRSHIARKEQRDNYLRIRNATMLIQSYYRGYRQTQIVKQQYAQIKTWTVYIQRKVRALFAMRNERKAYLQLRRSAIILQRKYKALIAMRKQREAYSKLKTAAIAIQRRYRAQQLMKHARARYLITIKACTLIQTRYRTYKVGTELRYQYLRLRNTTIKLQQRYRAHLAMKKAKSAYISLRSATVLIQRRYIARKLMRVERNKYESTLRAVVRIQRNYRAFLLGKKIRQEFIQMRTASIVIQKYYRASKEAKRVRGDYLRLLSAAIYVQRTVRARNVSRQTRRKAAAETIQDWYTSVKLARKCRNDFIEHKRRIIIVQSVVRMYIECRRYITMKRATEVIQKHYRLYREAKIQQQRYLKMKVSIIRLQAYVRSYIQRRRFVKIRSAVISIQCIYRLKRHRDLMKQQRHAAAVCIQKNVKCYLVKSRYEKLRKRVVYIQGLWREKLLTRLMRCDFVQKRSIIIKLQAVIRGYLVRKEVQLKKENLVKSKEERRLNLAASKIQALFRGNHARNNCRDGRVGDLRRRWRNGALVSSQKTLKELNEEAIVELSNIYHIDILIRAFKTLEMLTQVFPMLYNKNASSVVSHIYVYMSVMNRSVSSIEILVSAAAILVNLTRYKVTGPTIYQRDRIVPVLKFMLRFSNSETHLFCILSTYLWLFSKYDSIKEDLTEFLHIPENHKIFMTIKGNVHRMKRMSHNAIKKKINTPHSSEFVSHAATPCKSFVSNNSNLNNTPALEPDYSITRADNPRYFNNAEQAINCLFKVYRL